MRRLLVLCILWLASLNITAQKYCNEWINHSQQYFKFPIYKEGVYRIDSTTLASYYNLSAVNPKNFQLFLKGKEQFLFINGEGDGKINSNDYLEFYASPLMGDVDSLLYTDIRYVPNPYLPIFNDTIYAFLTLNNSVTNRRYSLETDTASASYPTGNYFYAQKVVTTRDQYNRVSEYDLETSDPRYTQAEGWGLHVNKSVNQIVNFPATNTYTNTLLPFYVSINFSGNSKQPAAQPDHQVQTFFSNYLNANVLLKDTAFYGYAAARQTFTLNNTDMNSNGTDIIFSSIAAPSFGTFTNQCILHYTAIDYPQRPDLGGQSFQKLFVHNSTSATKLFYKFANFNFTNAGSVYLYDVSNGRRITTVVANGQVRAVFPNGGSGRKFCVMVDESQVQKITALKKVNQTGYFTDYKSAPQGNKPFVIVYHHSLQSSADAYKNYRQSVAGGSYNLITADIDNLYEQFCYGINKHPLAIKHFINFLKDSLPVRPAYLLLVGKAVEYANLSPANQSLNLLPTMGIPSSDNLLTADATYTNTNVFSPDVPIGRLATLTSSDVANYLAKVQQHESSGTDDWKKRVLHFVGGDDPNLTSTLSSYMADYEMTIRDTLFGGDVYTFRKNTTAPIQLNISDSIKNIISHGAALLNFFGHGSQYGFDQAIDDPNAYNNTGRYPFVIANSCYSGNIHTAGDLSLSENFVFANQKGSIGFLATTDYGFIHALHGYTGEFYKSLSVTRYNKGIGDIIKETAAKNAFGSDMITRMTGLDMTLHGDPSLKISNGDLPDYILNNNDVSFDIKTYSDSIGVKIYFKNSGKAVNDSFIVRTQRYFANGDSVTIFKKIKAPYFKDSLKFFTLIDFNRGIGLNRFNIKLDYYNEISESYETNNSTQGSVDIFIPGGDIVPVYPYKYAIVPKTNTITLKASTTDPFAPLTTYRFELDTCDKFINPIRIYVVNSRGGVVEWPVPLAFPDSTVYFWRVSKDSATYRTPYVWRESSFQTINTKHGWGQAHFNQFKNDAYQFVKYKKNDRKFSFENNRNSVAARNGLFIATNINYYFNNINMGTYGCAPGGFNFAVFDSISGQPKTVTGLNYPSGGFGQYNNWVCVDDQVLNFYSFGPQPFNSAPLPNWKQDMENFLNAVPQNNYVMAYNVGPSNPNDGIPSYSNALYTAFEHIGAVNIRTTKDTVPYILFGQKGMQAGQGNEVVGNTMHAIITLQDSIETRWHNGYIASEVIGPANKWNSLHWRVKSLDASPGDHSLLKLVGIKQNGSLDTLVSFVQDSMDVMALYNYANAQTYPFLKLVAFMSDEAHRTSPQLKRWQILYDEAPECAINPLKGFASINDTLQEGDNVVFRFPIENISDKNFSDSLVVTYWIEDNNRNKTFLPQRLKARPFAPGQVIIDTVTINSYQLKGSNALWIYVNPLQNAKYQTEQVQFNNIGRYAFKVNADITNPLLDVTFDGVRILNGDIVSAKPNILITLKDENKFLALNDTGAFSVFMQSPGMPTQKRVYFGQGLVFTPASLPKNSASIYYNPALPVDGKYTLIVQARDRSKNVSGASDYRVDFEINNKPTVTNVLNYPNPFTTSTRFVFTLTGSEIPEVFTIRIMTITGKIVREITRSELGYLHIGRNITEYAWDARDTYGDRLGNGVYLYHVITKLNGSSIEKNNTAADKYFIKDFGKMVIMR